jgi:predicted transcriptional regulator of viral defense system
MPLERRIAELATTQHGVVALFQLLAFGLSAAAARYRVEIGLLHRVHAGVYSVGHARLTREARYMAAVLACELDSALSHRSASNLRSLWLSGSTLIDVISPRRPGRRRAGIRAHTSSTLLPRDVETVDGIPCTTVARTLLDLSAVVPKRSVERAFEQAEVLRVLDAREIEDVLARAGNHRGAGVLRAILDDHALGSTLTRNDLEEAFLAICDRAGLPRPEVNVWIAIEPTGYEADFLWRSHRLIAETDGGTAHMTRHAFQHDRRRDQRLTLAGYRVVRFPWQQVFDEPGSVELTIRGLLRQAA